MIRRHLLSCATLAAIAFCPCTALADTAAAPAAPAPTPPSMPSMAGPLAVNPNPLNFDIPDFGKIYVTGAATALGLAQDDHVAGDQNGRLDISNGQVFIQKTDGLFQFFAQAGVYSLPSLGTPYVRASTTTDQTYGVLPQGFLKLAPSDSFSVEAGKLPTLIGAESTFTFENLNIERGLLWNQEPAVSRGLQGNYTVGPVAFSASWNNGFYSNRYNWASGSATWTINSQNTLEAVAAGSLNRTTYSSSSTPEIQNNSEIYNLIYTYTTGPWTINPYLQYTYVPQNVEIGTAHSGSTYGAALLAKYAFDPNFNLAGRAEYIGSTGSTTDGSPNLLYGPGSKAWSLTLTPTYQYKVFFGRLDASYVRTSHTTPGSAFGLAGNDESQGRAVFETGILF
jgi:Putative beta-barrel porin-2, OmpL-like. bbp2